MLVIGSAGNIGQVLIPYLNSINYAFTAGLRNLESQTALKYKQLGVNLLKLDLSDPEDTLIQSFSNFKKILFITPSVPNRNQLMQNGFNALAKVKTVEFAAMISGFACRCPQDSSIGQSTFEIEEMLKKSVENYCILRLSWFYENNFGSINPIKNYKAICGPIDGSNIYQSVSLYDSSEAIAKIFSNYKQHTQKIYHFMSEMISFNDLAKAFSQVLGVEVKYQNKGYEFMGNVLKSIGFDEKMSGELLSLYKLIEEKKVYLQDKQNDLENIIQRKPQTNMQWILKHALLFKN